MVTFPNEKLDDALKFLQDNVTINPGEIYTMTGSGLLKNRQYIQDTLNIK